MYEIVIVVSAFCAGLLIGVLASAASINILIQENYDETQKDTTYQREVGTGLRR